MSNTRQRVRPFTLSMFPVSKCPETVKDAEIVIALWADADTRWDRLCERGDNQTNVIERIAYDNDAFAVIPCDYAVDANPDLDTVTESGKLYYSDACAG